MGRESVCLVFYSSSSSVPSNKMDTPPARELSLYSANPCVHLCLSSSGGKVSTARAATPPRSQNVHAAARSRRGSAAAKRNRTASPSAHTALETEAGRSSGSTPRAAAATAAAAGVGKVTEAVL